MCSSNYRFNCTRITWTNSCIYCIHSLATDFSTSFQLDIFYRLGNDCGLYCRVGIQHPCTRYQKIWWKQTRSPWKYYRSSDCCYYSPYFRHCSRPIWIVWIDRWAIFMSISRRKICWQTAYTCTKISTMIIYLMYRGQSCENCDLLYYGWIFFYKCIQAVHQIELRL